MSDFSPKRASEQEVFTVDFAPLLPAGVTIVSAPWSISAVDAVDPGASAMIQGQSSIVGSLVSHMIVGGAPGVRYAPICTALCSDGQTRVLPEYGFGYLDVTL